MQIPGNKLVLVYDLTLVLAGIAPTQAATGDAPQVPAGWTFPLPDGNVK